MKSIILTPLLSIFLLSAVFLYAQGLESPNGRLKLEFDLTEKGEPTYALTIGEQQVVEKSKLGLELFSQGYSAFTQPGQTLGNQPTESLYGEFELLSVTESGYNETWKPVWGEQQEIRNHYNELLVELKQQSTGKRMNVRFRLFDDGLGFRYEFPSVDNPPMLIVAEEKTEFALTGDHLAFWHPGDYDTQEQNYGTSRLTKIDENIDALNQGKGFGSNFLFSKTGVQTPILMKSDEGLYIHLFEAALVDYPALLLELSEDEFTFRAHLTPSNDGSKGYLHLPFHTPWRTIMVSDQAGDILLSNLIYNLNEPVALEDTSWIKPMKYMGVWWEMISGNGDWNYMDDRGGQDLNGFDYSSATPNARHSANTANVKRYLDFAAEHGFDGLLVEGWNIGWEDWGNSPMVEFNYDYITPYPDFDLEGIEAYAKSKGIQMIMHHETGGSIRNYERHMDRAYQFMVDHNYPAVKSGYVGPSFPGRHFHYSQYMVNHYLYAVKRAADYRIMVNAHEAVRPTGLARTYPNLIANESARGTEFEAFGGDRNNPDHTTLLPFLRLKGGPMDYTPGIFENNMRPDSSSHANTTLARQLALYVTMYSPLQMAADRPEVYEKHLDAFQFIKDVAIDWQKSLVLEAEPGDFITYARKEKGGERWFVGRTNDEEARISNIRFDFLDKGSWYKATVYADGADAHYLENPGSYTIKEYKVNSRSKLRQAVAPGGGYAISLEKIEDREVLKGLQKL